MSGFKGEGKVVEATLAEATTIDVLYMIGGLVGVASNTELISVANNFYVAGVFELLKTSGVTIAQGDNLYADMSGTKALTNVKAAGLTYIGKAWLAAASAAVLVECRLEQDKTSESTEYTDKSPLAKVAAYAVLTTDDSRLINLDGTSAVVPATLPDPALVSGKVFIFNATDITNAVTIAQNGSEEINGIASSYTLQTVGDAVQLMSDGVNWHIVTNESTYLKPSLAKVAAHTLAVTDNDRLIVLDGSSAVVPVQLPAPASCVGREYKFVCIDKTNAVTLVRAASENIRGAASDYTFATALDAVIMWTDGTDWFFVAEALNA